MVIAGTVVGCLLLVAGGVLTARTRPSGSGEDVKSDVQAIVGIVLMVSGVVLILSRFLR